MNNNYVDDEYQYAFNNDGNNYCDCNDNQFGDTYNDHSDCSDDKNIHDTFLFNQHRRNNSNNTITTVEKKMMITEITLATIMILIQNG